MNYLTLLWQTDVVLLTELLSAAVGSVLLATTDRTARGTISCQ
jgi:hypothetical protein